jgi:DNA replication protein DnaC
MAYAKLSAALLMCNRLGPLAAPAPPPVMAPALPPTRRLAPRTIEPTLPGGEEQKLLAQNLKALRLPMFVGEHDNWARLCAAQGHDHYRYLLRLTELELDERKRRSVERRIKAARFPAVKTLDEFDLAMIPAEARLEVFELIRCEYVGRRENVIAVGNSGTGKTHLAIGLGLAACHKGLSVGFANAAALAHELLEACREHRLARLQRRLVGYKLLIVDDLGSVTLPPGGAELLFDVLSQRCERGSTVLTSSLPTSEWTRVFGAERLTGKLLDRLTYRAHLLEMSGNNYRLMAETSARLH